MSSWCQHDRACVLVIDEERPSQRTLARILARAGHNAVCANTLQQGLKEIRCSTKAIRAVVLDVGPPRGSWMDGIRLVKDQTRTAPVIVVIDFADVPTAVQCMRLGAHDVLPKPLDSQRCVAAIEDGLRRAEAIGEVLASLGSSGLPHQLVHSDVEGRVSAAAIAWKLTPRLRDVLGQVLLGLENKEIARRIDCTLKTTEQHISALLEKSRMKSRSELIAFFLWGGLGHS